MIRNFFPFLTLFLVTIVFFWQFFLKGVMPIPADTIIGLYHPYRDLYAKDYPNGVPFKNFLITDPVRQQYPWKNLSIDVLKRFEIPAWNPYSFSGTPLLANFQSAVFYPLNIIFFILPFKISWSLLIFLQPLLAGIFLYLYLKNLKLDNYSSFFGAVVFSFSGFFTTWLEWGTILHTGLWLPLILLSIDKIFFFPKEISNSKYQIANIHIKNKKLLVWFGILLFSTVSSFFAGHLQTFFYISIVASVYVLSRTLKDRKFNILFVFLIFSILFLLLTSVQWIPTLKFITLSARELDVNWLKEGWFLPWQNLIQFIVPDFFGNPTTLNYWGAWNYGELTAYVGVLPLIISLFALIFRRDKKTYFFAGVLIVSLILILPTPIAKIPFVLNLPFISSSQPTRLIFLIDFSLAVLSAFGLNYLFKKEKLKEILLPIIIVGLFLVGLFGFIQFVSLPGITTENLLVARRNLIFPSMIFISSTALLLSFFKTKKDFKKYILCLLILLTVFDLFRFSWKFNTFSESKYLYPQTASIDFIKNNIGDYRIATADSRILPPNFSSIYGLQSIEGYDPLFLNRYAEFISAINRNKPNIDPPFGFNRIVRVENFSSDLFDLFGVKYVLSLSDVSEEGFIRVFEEGQTKVYENKNVYPRVFFINNVVAAKDKQDAINFMFDPLFDPRKTAIIEKSLEKRDIGIGKAEIKSYSENRVVITTENDKDGFLILTDTFYPTWHAKIDNKSEVEVFISDYVFRGIFVPAGEHTVQFYNTIL